VASARFKTASAAAIFCSASARFLEGSKAAPAFTKSPPSASAAVEFSFDVTEDEKGPPRHAVLANGGRGFARGPRYPRRRRFDGRHDLVLSQLAPSVRCSTAVPSACFDKAEFSMSFAKFATIFFYFDA
jgi:hypothetical protein